MKRNKKISIILYAFIISVLNMVVFTACDMEYTTIYNDVPGDTLYVSGDTYIKSFTVQEHADQQPIQAAIVNDTIKILWVSYHERPETITPEILLADKAVVTPASRSTIPFETGVMYTVTSEAGTEKSYTLQVDFRQPEPKTFLGMNNSVNNLGAAKYINGSSGGVFDGLWFNIEQTRVYFVSADDHSKEYDCEIAYFGPGENKRPFAEYGIYFYIPVTMPAGKYDLRIKNGEYILRDKDVTRHFNVDIIDDPDFFEFSPFNQDLSLQAGSTFSVRGMNLDIPVTAVTIAKNAGSAAIHYPLEIITRDRYSATFKLPDTIPADTYRNIFFFNGDIKKGASQRITVVN